MGVAHSADEDIHYKDYFIPRGATFLPATWWFLHDPAIYADPSSFDPDRYLEPRNEPHPNFASFGFGRRVCPGRFLADESLFISISRLLTAFEIRKAVDGRGNEVEPQISVTPGMISHIRDFPYDIKPRSENYAAMMRQVEVDHPWEQADATFLSEDLSLESEKL